MTTRKAVAVVLFAAIASALAGCSSTRGMEPMPSAVEDVSVTLANGRTFLQAVQSAATRRGWIPLAQESGTVRCTLRQREHLVVVDVVPNGDKTFSVRPVQSNIPVRKYDKWVNNLVREIVYRASF